MHNDVPYKSFSKVTGKRLLDQHAKCEGSKRARTHVCITSASMHAVNNINLSWCLAQTTL